MAHFPRGIAPELLVSQIKNTMPYLFGDLASESLWDGFVPAVIVRKFDAEVPSRITHFEYFRLCVCAHLLTCATLVPTDVDNQIRRKLWPEALPLEVALQMAQFVLECRGFDFTLVSARFQNGAVGSSWEKETIGGHHGEWFTIACAAYCALKEYSEPSAAEMRSELFACISDEVRRHSEIFGSLWRAENGISCLKAAASIAHNFGDLDRVMDMWDLCVGDPLRLQFYKLASLPFDTNRKLRYLGRLWVAGELYKAPIDGSSMAFENHRHFALRKPRSLRQHPDYIIPTGPFFDDWGFHLAQKLSDVEHMSVELIFEVIEALKHGWQRLPKTVGYGRALHGIFKVLPHLRSMAMGDDDFKRIRSAHEILETSQKNFESKWQGEALRLMEDIPSKA